MLTGWFSDKKIQLRFGLGTCIMRAANIKDKIYIHTQAWMQCIDSKLGKTEQRKEAFPSICDVLQDISWNNTNNFSRPPQNNFWFNTSPHQYFFAKHQRKEMLPTWGNALTKLCITANLQRWSNYHRHRKILISGLTDSSKQGHVL